MINHDIGASQRVAVGMTSPISPTPKVNGKIVVLGFKRNAALLASSRVTSVADAQAA